MYNTLVFAALPIFHLLQDVKGSSIKYIWILRLIITPFSLAMQIYSYFPVTIYT